MAQFDVVAASLPRHGGLKPPLRQTDPLPKRVAAEEFQAWKLVVRPGRTAALTCDDGNGMIMYTKDIEYTDFPLDEITFYFTNNVIRLPSEH